MLPIFMANNSPYSCAGNPKHFANFFMSKAIIPKFSNFFNLIFRQFGLTVFYAFMGAMLSCICSITCFCIPPKVFKKAIGADSISMTGFRPWRTRTDENKKNKGMNLKCTRFAIFIQPYLRVSTTVGRWLKYFNKYISQTKLSLSSSLPKRPYAPLITNFITRIIGDRFPYFYDCVKIIINHGRTSPKGWVVIEPESG